MHTLCVYNNTYICLLGVLLRPVEVLPGVLDVDG